MSTEFFEIFIRTEICRHPSLGPALQLKSNLRRCSIQFESAFAELHYRLIRAAVQLLFSQVSSARLHELSSHASSSCETKYVITDSSQRDTPISSLSQATEAEQYSSRYDAQSNNSQGIRGTTRSPARHNYRSSGSLHSKLHNQGSNRWPNTNSSGRVKDAQLQSPSCKQPTQICQPQRQYGQPQPQQRLKCEPQQTHSYANYQQQLRIQPQQQQAHSFAQCQAQKKQPTCPRNLDQRIGLACQRRLDPNPTKVRPPPIMRDGPSSSYPTLASHNRLAMAGWYIANMDALLSNLMRLFEMIYRDTLRMCGVGACELRELRSALPDPTLLSMQQRTSGHWRPNFMNCKIDFLLHLAAMVYRNTQDLRCGCPCNIPADPCKPTADGLPSAVCGLRSPPLPPPPPPHKATKSRSALPTNAPKAHGHECSGCCGANWNNVGPVSQGNCACNHFDHQHHAPAQTSDPVSSEEPGSTLHPHIIAPCRVAVAAASAADKTANSSRRLRRRVQGRQQQSDSLASASAAAGCCRRRPDRNSNNAGAADSGDKKLQNPVNRVMALLSKSYARVRSSSASGGRAGSSEAETDTGSTCLSVDIKISK